MTHDMVVAGVNAAGKKASHSSFGKDARLHFQSQFTEVRSKGCSQAGQYCVVNILMPPPDAKPRAAFSISKRYSKLAVVRNRARRLFREVYMRVHGDFPAFWIIFVPRKRIQCATMDDVMQDAYAVIRKILCAYDAQN